MPDLASQPAWVQFLLFACAATVIWFAGSRLAGYADALSETLHLARAFVGMLLLGAITSLPEMSAVATGAAYGNAPLAVNNLLGSLTINVLIIAVADATISGRALTSLVEGPAVLFQAILSMLAIVLVIAAMIIGSRQIIGVGYWSVALSAYVLGAFWIASGYRSPLIFQTPHGSPPTVQVAASEAQQALPKTSVASLILHMGGASIAVLASGYTLSRTGEGIGKTLGLSSGLAGYLLLGIATSLPELVTVLASVRLGRIDMAIGEVFGTNLFNIGLVAIADVVYRSGPILNVSSKFEILACLICLLQTGVYALGIMRRDGRTLLRLGLDSLVVVCLYLGGLLILSHVS